MVYSASAVLAMNRFNQPYFFLIKQAMWAALGLAAMSIAMRFDYRNYREPSFIWVALGVVVFALVAVLLSTPINGSRRWFGIGGFGGSRRARQIERSSSSQRCSSVEWNGSTIPHALVPIGVVVGGIVGLILLEPDLGTAMTLLLIAQPWYSRRG
jgi:cell division protein FtsW